jgi:hypothetical protein
MAYVDLNPVRARLAKTLEKSEHTSVQEHCIAHKTDNRQKLSKSLKQVLKDNPQNTLGQPRNLKPFSDQQQKGSLKNSQKDKLDTIPIERADYLQLVDWTGRAIRQDKKGAIPENLQPILSRLNINNSHWLNTVKNYRHAFGKIVGSITRLDEWRQKQAESDNVEPPQWLKGNKAARRFYC